MDSGMPIDSTTSYIDDENCLATANYSYITNHPKMGDLGDTDPTPNLTMAAAQQISITVANGHYTKP